MLLQKIKTISPEQAKEKLTDTEYRMFLYYQSGKRSKDINKACIQLEMSKQRFAKTRRSLEYKLSKM